MKVMGAALVLLGLVCFANGFNITDILNAYPDYSQFNQLLTKTKLADEINSRQTITVLAVSNANMGSLNGMPLATVKNALSFHVVLDFYDTQKLHAITNGTTLSTTLYQTTGNAPGNAGFVNITDLKGGKVGFGLAAKGSKLDSTFVKSVKQEGYNISVIEVSQPITTAVAQAPATAPAPPPANMNISVAPASEPVLAPTADAPKADSPKADSPAASSSPAAGAPSDSPSAAAKIEKSFAVASCVSAWALISSVAAFGALIMF